MKELSIEENAKAYTELINRLEDVKEAIKEHNYGIAMDMLCKPYPAFQIITLSSELKESEDAWSEEDEAIYYGVIETEQYMLDVVNGIKKFNVGNISIKEECTRELNWLKSLKNKVQPQSKQEWSEEDKEKMRSIFLGIEAYCPSIIYGNDKEEVLSWLKSLKDRYTWKPSDEQIVALKHASNDCSIAFADMKILATLYEQLKALHRYEQDT